MSNSIETSPPWGSSLHSLSTAAKVRFGAFILVVLAILALTAVMMRVELAMVYTGWFQDVGTHQVHDQMIFTFLWITLIVPVALLRYHPSDRVNATLAPALYAVPWAVLAFLAGSPILALGAIFDALGLVALALHPAGRSLVRFDRGESVDRRIAGLFAVGAVPLAIYGGSS